MLCKFCSHVFLHNIIKWSDIVIKKTHISERLEAVAFAITIYNNIALIDSLIQVSLQKFDFKSLQKL